MTPNPYVSNKNPSAIKSLRIVTETLDVKHNSAIWRFGAAKDNHESIKMQLIVVTHCKEP